ncbi:MAG: V-type ATP synthase subunit I [Mangrovibacterium sp.]
MKKYSFVAYHKEYTNFLEQLREVGLLHVQVKTLEEIGENASLLAELNKVSSLMQLINLQCADYLKDKEAPAEACPPDVVNYIQQNREKLETLEHELAQLHKEQDFMSPWGDYNPLTMQQLANADYELRFYIADKSTFDAAQLTDACVLTVNESDREYFLMQANRKGDALLELQGAEEVQLLMPHNSYAEQIVACKQAIVDTEHALNVIAAGALKALEAMRGDIQSKINFEQAYKSGDKYADDQVIGISGWVPAADADAFEQKLKEFGVLYVEEPMTEEDDRPIKLKNNWFNRLYEPIGDLYTLPTHREFDLTPFFAPFYMLFFGFCLGDAGYGLLIVLASLWAMKKLDAKAKPMAWLGFSLGLSTTIMGILTGTAFGVMFGLDGDGNPLQSAEWLRTYQEWVISQDNLMLLAFGLGFLQVVVGMLVKSARLIVFSGLKYALSQIGWTIIVAVALPIYGLGNYTEIMEASQANQFALIALIVGAIPALFYNSPKSNIFANFGTGLWDTYNMASGLLGDILSYVRLFALGLSSAILGNVFNSLAVELSPDVAVIGPIVTILILLFGHGLNFALALLGSAVHPLRLTFVEFYKNAGFEGGGMRYAPFRK